MKHMVLRYIKLWLAFFRNSLTRDMEFKMNFIADLFIDGIFYGSMYFFFMIIFSYVDSLGDFSKEAKIIQQELLENKFEIVIEGLPNKQYQFKVRAKILYLFQQQKKPLN